MRPFRFSILQLLLAATLVGLVLGLVTSAWRASNYQSIEQICFSPEGKHLAARYMGGAVQVWRLDSGRPRLVAKSFGREGIFSGYFSSIHFIANDKLLKIDTEMFPAGGVKVRQLDLNNRQVTEVLQIQSIMPMGYGHAATAEWLVITDSATSTVACYSLKTSRLERKWTLPMTPWIADISAEGNLVAVSAADRQVYLIHADEDGAPRKIDGIAPLALSPDGRLIASTSPAKAGVVYLHDPSAGNSPTELTCDLMTISALAIGSDNASLIVADPVKIDFYDLPTKKRVRRIEIDDPAPGQSESCAVSPQGDWLASRRGSDIVLYDLAHGNQRHLVGGDLRLLEVVIFTLGFAVWSVIWGIVAKRERLRQPAAAVASSLPVHVSSAARPVPSIVAWKWQLPWALTMLLASLGLIAGLQISAGQSPGVALFDILQMLAIMFGVGVTLFVALCWIAFFVVGPHRTTLVRLRALAGDKGRLVRSGRLTFWFVGNSRLECESQTQLDEVLTNAEDLLGRPVEPRRRRLIACLDRQCDLDAYFGRHVPLAAAVPRSWIDRVTLVCEEAAMVQLLPPRHVLRSALAISIVIDQKLGDLAAWFPPLLAQQIARDERRPAEVRAAIRRLKVRLARQPNWDPAQVFHRTARERFKLLMMQEDRSAWLEIRAESDLLLTLGEMLLGPDAPVDLRQKTLAWLRAARPKDDPRMALARDVGLTLDALLEQWRNWLASRTGLPYDPMPADRQWLLREVAMPALANEQLPLALRQRMVRQLGAFYVAAAPPLIDLLAHAKIELRRQAAEALELLAGETWGDDQARWQSWWQSISEPVRGEPTANPLGRMIAAASGHAAGPAMAGPAPAAGAPAVVPPELTFCWRLMFGGGVVALLIPIGLLFLSGPLIFPMVYYSLFVGIAAIARGAARDTAGLPRIAGLQIANAIVCDPVNLIAGWIERLLLNRPHVRQYLLLANGGRL